MLDRILHRLEVLPKSLRRSYKASFANASWSLADKVFNYNSSIITNPPSVN